MFPASEGGARYCRGRKSAPRVFMEVGVRSRHPPSLYHGTVSGTTEGEDMVQAAMCSMFCKYLSEKEKKHLRKKRKKKRKKEKENKS